MKNTNNKMTKSQLSTTEPKKTKTKQTTRTGTDNHRNGDHMEGLQRGVGGERKEGKVQGIRSINGRYKIDRGKLRIVWEMEKPKNLHV